jgi:hypothetical protein
MLMAKRSLNYDRSNFICQPIHHCFTRISYHLHMRSLSYVNTLRVTKLSPVILTFWDVGPADIYFR